MPRVLAQQPQWLDRGSPAFDLFQSTDTATQTNKTTPDAPIRRIAHRGTEVFVVVGNELRWADLGVLKDQSDGNETQSSKTKSYKLLRVPTSRTINQLSISPSGELIAIATSHTCHICVLPARERLNTQDEAPIPLKYFQLGPTAHVLEQSPLMSMLWHPLSSMGNDLITITKAAVVRLWELDRLNRGTFDEPALAVDLKKLGNATSVRADLSASKYGVSKGFSPDEVEMEVAAGTFGGSGRDDEDGWSSMTLWVSMTEGDVYALCPFLPARFCAPRTVLATLTTSVVAKTRILEQDRQVTEAERQVAEQQSSWLAAVDEQDPIAISKNGEEVDVFARPLKPGAIPRLQGPFRITPEPDFGEITDIHVIAPKTNEEALFDDDEWDDFEHEDGLSIGIVCLATSTGQIHVCLSTDGVEAEWLPSKRARSLLQDEVSERELLLVETVDTSGGSSSGPQPSWPTFTSCPTDRYSIFTTQSSGIYSISLAAWVTSLEDELSAPQVDTAGIGLRAGIMLESPKTTIEALTAQPSSRHDSISAAIVILESTVSNLGYLILTSTNNGPQAVLLDEPTPTHPFAPDTLPTLPSTTPRAPFQPSQDLYKPSTLPSLTSTWRAESATNTAGDLRAQIQLTPYTLQKMTGAHRVLSSETHVLGLATADLFRRCERLLSELQSQVQKVRDLSDRIDGVTGADPFPEDGQAGEGSDGGMQVVVRGGGHIEERIRASREKTTAIRERVERLRRKARGVGGTELSAREQGFAEEVGLLEKNLEIGGRKGELLKEKSDLTVSTDESEAAEVAEEGERTIVGRFEAVKEFYEQIRNQAEEMRVQLEEQSEKGVEDDEETQQSQRMSSATRAGGVGEFRRQKLSQVMALLERETALVDAVSERLKRLQTGL